MLEDEEVLAEEAKATKELADLLKELDIQADYFIHDWKATADHITDIAKFLQSHPGWVLYFFIEGYCFEGGSGDDHVTVLTSKPIPEDKAEKIADLVYNYSADPPEYPEPEAVMVGCSHCATCGGTLNLLSIEGDVATNHNHLKCSACGIGWIATYQKGVEELLLNVAPEQKE